MKQRGVSFIVPAYNEEDNVGACIASIVNDARLCRYMQALPWEVVVVDNASTDYTARVVQWWSKLNPSVRLVHEDRKGLVWARQKGADEARYSVHACIDADNRIPMFWCDTMLEQMALPGTVAVSGPLLYENQPKATRLLSKGFFYAAAAAHRVIGPMLQGGNYAYEAAALERAGGYDRSVEFFGEDTTTARRLASVGRVRYCLDLVAVASDRRFVEEGLVRTTARYVGNYLNVTFRGKPLTQEYNDVRPSA
jgi:glycosyltransferase involved in cell wall biosynthesis